jgi:hypothetical protein
MAVLPSHSELQLPLLEVLRQCGPMSPADATRAVADKLNLPREVAELRRPMPGWSSKGLPVLQHRLRWVCQELIEPGFVERPGRGIWDIAQRGRKFLIEARPGVVINVFETDLGMALWADARDAVAAVQDGALNCCFSSPPYPIVRGRAYGTFSEDQLMQLILDYCRALRPKLADDASVFLNFGNVTRPGGAASLYKSRLLLELCDTLAYEFIQEHVWVSPSKPPTGHFVTRTRTRLKDGFETIFQLGKSANVRANNANILGPYKATMRRTLARGGDARASRPSGQGHNGHSFDRDNGGAIPANVQILSNAASNSAYHRAVRAHRLQPHPARFPAELPERMIRYTTDRGDLVGDFFGGSLTVPTVCERLGRQWVAADIALDYLRGGEIQFRGAPGYQSHLVEGAVLLPPEWTGGASHACIVKGQSTQLTLETLGSRSPNRHRQNSKCITNPTKAL